MKTKWNQTTFGQFASLHRGYDLPKSQRTEGDVPVIGSNGVAGYHGVAKFDSFGVMVGRSGSVGKTLYINGPHWPLNTTLYVEDFHGNCPRFVDFFCRFFDFAKYAAGVSVPTLNRNLVHKADVSIPPFPEQVKIAAVLLKIQRTIEKQDEIIHSLRALKKSTMQHLFTNGLYGEKTKMTEIGEIPKSWDVMPLGSIAEIKHGYAFKSNYFTNDGDYILLTPGNFFEEGGFRDEPEKRKYFSGPIPQDFILNGDELLVAMTEQARGLLGSSLIVPKSSRYLHNQRLGLVQISDENRLRTTFAYHLFNTSHMRQAIALSATGMKVRHTAPSRILEIPIPLPSENEQLSIAKTLDLLALELQAHDSKKAAIQDLFMKTLNKLMTGDIRVAGLDIDMTEAEA